MATSSEPVLRNRLGQEADDAATVIAVHQSLLRELADTAPSEFELVPDRDVIRDRLTILVHAARPLLDATRQSAIAAKVFDAVLGLGAIEPLLGDPTVSEIMLNGPGRAFVERDGRIEPLDLDLDAAAIELIAQRIVAPLGLRLDRAAPVVDARLADGSRLHAVLPPLAPDGPVVTIRKFAPRRIALSEFGLSAKVVDALAAAVHSHRTVLIAGGTSTGKTTFLNALARCIDPRERILTIEETAELQLGQPHVVRLEARMANAEGAGATSVRDLVRASLRMRPDRLIVGEVRGGEAIDLLQALNTGHRGSLCTLHANTAADALSRLETLALFGAPALPLMAIRAQVRSAIDLVVHIERTADGQRRVDEIVEVLADPGGWEEHVASTNFEPCSSRSAVDHGGSS